MLELEKLKANQIIEAKRLQDQIEALRKAIEAEKAKLREEHGKQTDKILKDYKEALKREKDFEQRLKDKEKALIERDAKMLALKGPDGGAQELAAKAKQLQESRKLLKKDLDDATSMIVQMEEKLKLASTKAMEHMKKNADTEKENRKLNLHLKDLKRKVPGEIYAPMKYDPVD